MSVTGQWVNVYGSVVNLTQQGNTVFGTYASTTGSSGAYWVAGFCNPNLPTDGSGQSVAWSILWRSFEKGVPDPSWHYVSGFSGQMLPTAGTSLLVMTHDLVATTPDPGVVPGLGGYIQTLTYQAATGLPVPGQWPPPFVPPQSPDPVDGNWRCVQDPAVRLSIAVQDTSFGFLTGTLSTAAGATDLAGFTDDGAGAAGLYLQGLTITALLPDGATVVALAGSLDLRAGTLSLAWLKSLGTAAASTWTQTRIAGMDFVRA
ncbi:MAG TPA: avidin/streptavidin family protein [Thermoanaerobaculia bacterium]|nr:avidin/streptavidin family protein [Thermoanaerobaculia bacterium]